MSVSEAISSATGSSETLVWIAHSVGMFTSILFTLQYFPQAMLNYKRKSTEGFSSTGIIIKLIGAAFLCVNSWLSQETFAVVAYGLFNVFQHSLFLVQFYQYEQRNNNQYLMWLLFPIVPATMGVMIPSSVGVTNVIKPAAQLFSHIPQLMTCVRLKTTKGVSMTTQHMNMIGGLCGLFMCYVIAPKSTMTWFLYINSMLQAATLYATYLAYDWKTKGRGLPVTMAREQDHKL